MLFKLEYKIPPLKNKELIAINVVFKFVVVDTRVNITIRLTVTKVVLNELSNGCIYMFLNKK